MQILNWFEDKSMRLLSTFCLLAITALSGCSGFIGDSSADNAVEVSVPQSTVDLLYGDGAAPEGTGQ